MSNKSNRISVLYTRIGRLERKCNRVISEVTALRKALTPHRNIDDVLIRLHRTALALQAQSKSERKYYSRIVGDV